jgi:hypothetical protein
MKQLRGLALLLCMMVGCSPAVPPSYAVQESVDGLVVVLRTPVGEIPVEIKRASGSGQGTGAQKGTANRSGKTVSYEVKYQHTGSHITLTSVKLDGKEIARSTL